MTDIELAEARALCEPTDLPMSSALPKVRAALVRALAEVERLRAVTVLTPLTTDDVVSALHEGHAERRAAEGDNAWTSLLRQRDTARDASRQFAAAYDRAVAEKHQAIESAEAVIVERIAEWYAKQSSVGLSVHARDIRSGLWRQP